MYLLFRRKNFQEGFSLIEILIVIAILLILTAIAFFNYQKVRVVARNLDRTTALSQFHNALQEYYIVHQSYPQACGIGLYSYAYTKRQPDKSCSGSITLKFDNSTSPGFLSELYTEGFINTPGWNDPLNPTDHSDIQNCRYVVPCSLSKSDCLAGLCPPPQKYLLHCNLEDNPIAEANDNGTNNTLFEIIEGDPWVCVTGTYN